MRVNYRLRFTDARQATAIFALAVSFTAVLGVTPASAVNTVDPEYGSIFPCGDLEQATYSYSSDSEWNSTTKPMFEYGLDAWRWGVKNHEGGWILTKSGTTFTAEWYDLGPSGDNAKTWCAPGNHRIQFNSWYYNDYATGARDMRSVSAHEWGHVWGLGHVGHEDTWPTSQSYATMATCIGPTDTSRRTLSHDDEAAIAIQDLDQVVGGYATASANSSFEESGGSGTEYWYGYNVSSFYTASGGADSTPRHARFRGGVVPSQIYNETTLNWYRGGYLKARANYMKDSTNDSGSVTVMLGYQRLDRTGGCGELADLTAPIESWVWVSTSCYPSNSWGYCTTSPAVVSGVNDRVIKTRAYVLNYMTRFGLPAYLRTDRNRVMVKGASVPW